jgi:hypothetical protein
LYDDTPYFECFGDLHGEERRDVCNDGMVGVGDIFTCASAALDGEKRSKQMTGGKSRTSILR